MEKEKTHLMHIGQKIKSKRKLKGWSQETLAEYVDIHPTYMSQIETGKVNMTINILKSIADSLGVTMSSLVKDSMTEDELTQILNEIKTAYYRMQDDERMYFLQSVRAIAGVFSGGRMR
jgi:transcriptional regulator with XRE-family HTH domain